MSNIRKRLAEYYINFGLRGVLAISAYPLFGRPKEIIGHPPGVRHPVHLRVRTTDPSIYAQILLHGQYALDLPFSPKTIVDAGANIGMASVYFAHRYPEAKVIAIEPEASNFAVLARNVSPYPAIIPVHAALWNRDGQISVSQPERYASSVKLGFVTHEGPGTKVRAVTMHMLMGEMSIPAIDLAKIDIEGAEQEVFEDIRWLSGMRCLMIELHDWCRPGCSEAVNRAMQGFARSQRGDTTFYVRQT